MELDPASQSLSLAQRPRVVVCWREFVMVEGALASTDENIEKKLTVPVVVAARAMQRAVFALVKNRCGARMTALCHLQIARNVYDAATLTGVFCVENDGLMRPIAAAAGELDVSLAGCEWVVFRSGSGQKTVELELPAISSAEDAALRKKLGLK